MKTNQEHSWGTRKKERGNALIYVLLAVALFAALTFMLSRGGEEGDSTLSDEKAELYATQLISYAAQAKSAVDQMLFSGSYIDDLSFVSPSDSGTFESGSNIHKVYHPEGGGLSLASLPGAVVSQNISDPAAGWYMGSFNNVDWTDSSSNDVILVAYQISSSVCAKINEKINGSTTIPQMNDSIKEVMIDDAHYTAGTNTELTTGTSEICEECNSVASLCVQNEDGNAYGFYTIIADQ